MATSPDTTRLHGVSVLITGGASGLGLATALAFAQGGAYVTIADLQPPQTDLAGHTAHGQHLHWVKCDITNWGSLIDTFQAAIAFSPTKELNTVCTFAGVDLTPHLVDQIKATATADPSQPPPTPEFDINLRGTFYTTYLALHHFHTASSSQSTSEPARQGHSLVLVSSMLAYVDDLHSSSYAVSKAGVRSLFRSVRARVHELGSGEASGTKIRVNLIAPWIVETPLSRPVLDQAKEMGITDGKGITLASAQTVADCAVNCAMDNSIDGEYSSPTLNKVRKAQTPVPFFPSTAQSCFCVLAHNCLSLLHHSSPATPLSLLPITLPRPHLSLFLTPPNPSFSTSDIFQVPSHTPSMYPISLFNSPGFPRPRPFHFFPFSLPTDFPS